MRRAAISLMGQKRSFSFAPLGDWCIVTSELPRAGRADFSAKGERAAPVPSAGRALGLFIGYLKS
jgi:hypothetical protein